MLGGWEWIIILIIVIVLFGPGRLTRIGGELGSAITNFRKGLRDESSKEIEGGKKDDPVKPA
ncbi:MAG: twin-arginine translocase TatA/TatE family subunit [Anaerolineae bacterium]|jgi:sec-independent protein translocase protein TatA|nr:twin-arginine translocase TatA/TatE family subunit [Anaerolineae bacterium]